MKIVNNSNKQQIDLDTLIEEAFQKYDAVFFSEIEGELFVYRPLGRKEYKDILGNINLSDFDKQDAICQTVLLHPLNYDFDDCIAGIPDKLYQDVIEKSCLDPESMLYLLHMNRQEAEQLGSEMACIIAEAFPSYTIDEIESWNNFKFMKVFSQAEWILTNIRGVQFQIDIANYLAEIAGITDEELINMGIKEDQYSSVNQPVSIYDSRSSEFAEPVQPKQSNSIHGETPGKGMSAEQYRAYQDFIRQHPEFANAMQYDAAFTGMETQTADTTNPALRPGWYHNH